MSPIRPWTPFLFVLHAWHHARCCWLLDWNDTQVLIIPITPAHHSHLVEPYLHFFRGSRKTSKAGAAQLCLILPSPYCCFQDFYHRTWRFLNCSYLAKVINKMWDAHRGSNMFGFLPTASTLRTSSSPHTSRPEVLVHTLVHTVKGVNISSTKIAQGRIPSPYFDSYSDNVRSRRDFVYFLKEFKKRSRAHLTVNGGATACPQ